MTEKEEWLRDERDAIQLFEYLLGAVAAFVRGRHQQTTEMPKSVHKLVRRVTHIRADGVRNAGL